MRPAKRPGTTRSSLSAIPRTLVVSALWLVLSALGLSVLYLLVLTLASVLRRREELPPVPPSRRFAILVPAHDEETVIAEALGSLERMRYPRDLFDVHVVADNCGDRTAKIARSFARDLSVTVHERRDPSRRGKGYALRWIFDRLAAGPAYDAYVVLDADCTASPNCLEAMNARFQLGAAAVQVWYRADAPDRSWVAGLRHVAFALTNYVQPLGKSALGLSCGLNGTGMALAASVLNECAWDSYSLAEDGEQHLKLVLSGRRVSFAPEASVASRMPATLAAARSQNLRWESGKLALARAYVSPLLRGGLAKGNPSAIAAALGQLVPPLSVLTALSAAALAAGALLRARRAVAASSAILAGLVLHVVIGLVAARSPLAAYRSLVFAPAFILWKLPVYAAAAIGRGRQTWARTRREGDTGLE